MEAKAGKQQVKSQRAQEAICAATIESLFEVGYGETSLNKVAAMAGFSKGALQHHFPSKEDLISATVDRLLNRAIPSSSVNDSQKHESVEAALLWSWNKMVNTRQYRALLEVLNAARADQKLQDRISKNLKAWGRALDQQAIAKYRSINGNDEDVRALMSMTRSFMRGLIIEERYIENPEENMDHLLRWIHLISPQLELRKNKNKGENNV